MTSTCVAHICRPILVTGCTDVVIIDAHVHAIAATHLPTSIAAAKLGGVGIAMVRAMTEEFSYQYRRGENHLRVRLAL